GAGREEPPVAEGGPARDRLVGLPEDPGGPGRPSGAQQAAGRLTTRPQRDRIALESRGPTTASLVWANRAIGARRRSDGANRRRATRRRAVDVRRPRPST